MIHIKLKNTKRTEMSMSGFCSTKSIQEKDRKKINEMEIELSNALIIFIVNK